MPRRLARREVKLDLFTSAGGMSRERNKTTKIISSTSTLPHKNTECCIILFPLFLLFENADNNNRSYCSEEYC